MRDLLDLIQILSEDAVGMSPGQIVKHDWRWNTFIDYIKSKKPFTTISGDEVTIDPREAKRFIDLRNQDMFKGNLSARTITGDEIALSKLAKTIDFGGAAAKAGENPEQAGKEALIVKPTQIGLTGKDIPASDFYDEILSNSALSGTDYGQVIQKLAEYIRAGEYVMLPDEYKGKEKEKVRKAIVDYAGEYLGVLALLYNRSRFPRKDQFLKWLGGDIGELTLNFPAGANNNIADSFAIISNRKNNRTLNISSKGTGGGAAPAISGLTIPDHIKSDPKYTNLVKIIEICKTPPVLMSVFKLIDLLYSINPKSIDKKYHSFLPFLTKEPDLPMICKRSIDSKKLANQIGVPKKYKSLWADVVGGGTEGGKIIYAIREEIQEAINKRNAIPEFQDGILEILEMNFIQQYCDYKGGELTFATQWPAKLDGKVSIDNKSSTNDPIKNGFSFKLGRTDTSVSSEVGEPEVDGLYNFSPDTAHNIAEPEKVTKLSDKSIGNVGRKKR